MPDSALAPALRAAGGEFENAWNALLVAELRATLARADSARALAALERRVAAAEPQALGTRIAADALALRGRWNPRQCARRVAAAEAEAAGTAAQRAGRWAESDSRSARRSTPIARSARGAARPGCWAAPARPGSWPATTAEREALPPGSRRAARRRRLGAGGARAQHPRLDRLLQAGVTPRRATSSCRPARCASDRRPGGAHHHAEQPRAGRDATRRAGLGEGLVRSGARPGRRRGGTARTWRWCSRTSPSARRRGRLRPRAGRLRTGAPDLPRPPRRARRGRPAAHAGDVLRRQGRFTEAARALERA